MKKNKNENIKNHSRKQYFIAVLLERRGYFFILVVTGALFAIYYYILTPSNFTSFSDTLRYFISSLATLLAVVVGFNTLALRNQLNTMPTNLENLSRQLNNIEKLLDPLLKHNAKIQSDSQPEMKPTLRNPIIYYKDALEKMLSLSSKFAGDIIRADNIGIEKNTHAMSDKNNKDEIIANKISDNTEKHIVNICRDFVAEITSRLYGYQKFNNAYFLVTVSTTDFVERLNYEIIRNDKGSAGEFFDIIKKLHVLRNICIRIYMRNSLTTLSYEMLVITIPIITIAAIISAISNYELYNTFYLRILFAVSMSAVISPFVLLFIRALPILQIIHSVSALPFAQKNN